VRARSSCCCDIYQPGQNRPLNLPFDRPHTTKAAGIRREAQRAGVPRLFATDDMGVASGEFALATRSTTGPNLRPRRRPRRKVRRSGQASAQFRLELTVDKTFYLPNASRQADRLLLFRQRRGSAVSLAATSSMWQGLASAAGRAPVLCPDSDLLLFVSSSLDHG
jgi:hypothetical protein